MNPAPTLGPARSSLGWTPLIAAVLLAVSLSGCAVNPVTGQRQFVFFSESQEIQLGRDADRDIVQSLGVYESPELEEFVEEVGRRMAQGSERPNLPWTFRVLDDPTVNAFALPGGYIYLTRGILAHLTSEAEVAGILGHEIGHVTARHGVVRVSRAQLAQVGLGAATILAPELRPFEGMVGAGVQLLFLSNSRSDERQADELGIRYMNSVGYDPRELAQVFRMLARASGAQDGDRIPGFLSTHPDPLDRRNEVLQQVEAAEIDLTEVRVGRESYLRLLEGMTFGNDPREGFFRNGVFHHPDMAFRITFPSGWGTANGRTQVQGMSPERDAALLLTLVEEEDPSRARASFLSQSGMETLQRVDDGLHGLPAAGADFRARTDEGVLRGQVLFVRHGGLTFRILGYAVERAWPARSQAIGAALRSFQEETDEEVLGTETRTLTLVETPRAMTAGEFLQEFPSSVSDDTVLQINHLQAGDSIPEGTLLKRVVGAPPV